MAITQLQLKEKERLSDIFNSYIVSKTSSVVSTMLGEDFKHKIQILENGVSKIKAIQLSPEEIKFCAVHLKGEGDTNIGILYTMKEKYAKKIADKKDLILITGSIFLVGDLI